MEFDNIFLDTCKKYLSEKHFGRHLKPHEHFHINGKKLKREIYLKKTYEPLVLHIAFSRRLHEETTFYHTVNFDSGSQNVRSFFLRKQMMSTCTRKFSKQRLFLFSRSARNCSKLPEV